MMRVIIRNSDKEGKCTLNFMKNNFDVDVLAFFEPIWASKKQTVAGLEVISEYHALELYKSGQIDKYIIPGSLSVSALLGIKRECENFEINSQDIIVIPHKYVDGSNTHISDEECDEVINHHEFNYLQYLEFHIVDHCNLNCKNCTHFSPLVTEKTYADFDVVKRDLLQLKKFVDNIGTIRIMGGECLLNPDLSKYVDLVKRVYPLAHLAIATNGLLLANTSEHILDTLRENGVIVHISAYPPMFDKIDEITDLLEKNEIKWQVIGPITSFSTVINLNERLRYPFKTTFGQWGCGCYNLYNGKIAICPTACYSFYYDKFKNTKILEELSQDGIVDLFETKSFSELNSCLERPIALCEYCTLYRSRYDRELQQKWEIFKKNEM